MYAEMNTGTDRLLVCNRVMIPGGVFRIAWVVNLVRDYAWIIFLTGDAM